MATPEAETKVTTLAALKGPANNEAHLPEVAAGFNSLRAFELLQRSAKALSQASLVPEIYRGNTPNCIIALEMAQRIGASPLLVMQNLYVVYGSPHWSAKFLIACFNQCGRFTAARYIWTGTRGKDDWGCQAWAVERETGEKILGPVITMELAKAEGWYGRKDSKWKTMPEKMFMYRAAAWMIDTHAPELSMGIRTVEEAHDTFDAARGPDGRYSVTTESLRQAEQSTERPALQASQSGQSSATEDPTEWASKLLAIEDPSELDPTWEKCCEAFGNNPPDECDAAYQNRKEAFAEKAGKDLDEKASSKQTSAKAGKLDL